MWKQMIHEYSLIQFYNAFYEGQTYGLSPLLKLIMNIGVMACFYIVPN